MRSRKTAFLFLGFWAAFAAQVPAQHSIARTWVETSLDAIRLDFPRPTVQARNLFHFSGAMYDAWTVFDGEASPYLLGQTVHGYYAPFEGFTTTMEVAEARDMAISYAAFGLMKHRFAVSPRRRITLPELDSVMTALGYDPTFTDTDYTTGNPAALGNYIAQQYITYGLQDGANEINNYEIIGYESVNDPLLIHKDDNADLADPNRWQAITLELYPLPGGGEIEGVTGLFLNPEWGQVSPFAQRPSRAKRLFRDGQEYYLYHDPGPPPYINLAEETEEEEWYAWGFELVMIWSEHLTPSDSVIWDISPASIGNLPAYPTSREEYPDFYNFWEGGDPSRGHAINPHTGEPYEPQLVPRGDYARILAEFWADGPDSETPPGHWFSIFNQASDHPAMVKKIGGEGEVVDDLEWDIKGYFALGGTVHDAGVTSWSIKGWYDYIRPVSALRWMATQGQRSDSTLASYHPDGIRLYPGFIELIEKGDPDFPEDAGKIKFRAWRGPQFIEDEAIDTAGVGWILSKDWWPYQRPSLVTPPFAGYVSGHSTYSRAAAETMTRFTGDAYFPGGMGEFAAPQNEYLVFEEGPSIDVTLQWATYVDAADQCSLSRIWGGIHPPADDIPGRLIGIDLGTAASDLAFEYFAGTIETTPPVVNGLSASPKALQLYPNPAGSGQWITVMAPNGAQIKAVRIFNPEGKEIATRLPQGNRIDVSELPTGLYLLQGETDSDRFSATLVVR